MLQQHVSRNILNQNIFSSLQNLMFLQHVARLVLSFLTQNFLVFVIYF